MSEFTFAYREEGFDTHISKSIRGYDNLIQDIVDMSRYFIEDNTTVIDIGCSTGKLLEVMLKYNNQSKNVYYIGYEIENGFFNQLDELVKKNKNIIINKESIVNANPVDKCSLITSIFTIQFIPRVDRQAVFDYVYNNLQKHGAFIFTEKLFNDDYRVQEMLTFMSYDYKRNNFSDTDILDKEKQLRHMLKPNKRCEIIDMCRKAGFSVIEQFWQNFNFVGFIAIK